MANGPLTITPRMLKLATLSWVENGEIKGGERRQRQVDTFGIGGERGGDPPSANVTTN